MNTVSDHACNILSSVNGLSSLDCLLSKSLFRCVLLYLVSATRPRSLSSDLGEHTFFLFRLLTMAGHDRGQGRSMHTRSMDAPSPTRTYPEEIDDIELDRIGPARMLQYLHAAGVLPEPNPELSGVPSQPPADPAAVVSVATVEALLQRLLAQAPPVVQHPPAATSPFVSAPAPASTGKPSLKFPDPPMFEGDPVKLDGWLTQTQMYLKAYDVDLSTARCVDIATMFLRGKAQDWWTGQFHLQEAGQVPVLGTWVAFVEALTEAFRPVELHRKYIDQMLNLSQGKQDMRSYIASFNALRAKIPEAFPEQTLSHLFLQGCRGDLQKNIALQYPKTLAEHFQHAIALSDLPNSSKNPVSNTKNPGDPKGNKDKPPNTLTCGHCHKPGHTEDRCFLLHPELRKRRSKSAKP